MPIRDPRDPHREQCTNDGDAEKASIIEGRDGRGRNGDGDDRPRAGKGIQHRKHFSKLEHADHTPTISFPSDPVPEKCAERHQEHAVEGVEVVRHEAAPIP